MFPAAAGPPGAPWAMRVMVPCCSSRDPVRVGVAEIHAVDADGAGGRVEAARGEGSDGGLAGAAGAGQGEVFACWELETHVANRELVGGRSRIVRRPPRRIQVGPSSADAVEFER